MSYAGNRVIYDADGHIMELPTHLREFADPDLRELIPLTHYSASSVTEEEVAALVAEVAASEALVVAVEAEVAALVSEVAAFVADVAASLALVVAVVADVAALVADVVAEAASTIKVYFAELAFDVRG